ncbi:COP9 signalosome complex subunit 8 [Platanthera guangdongensis]|uniref:COP9 signalosome complex subunit 8 n=1 Tax=Platanthera guangdongensis TaxID=2320717 RepID=A0ABR2LR77_9ASPA
MDLSELQDALASKSFGKIGEICDNLMLQVASTGISFQQDWPYSIHLLGHVYANDLNSARFLWKSIPSGVKESRAEVVAAWKIGQCLWNRDYAGVHASIRGFDWSPEAVGLVTAFGESYAKRNFQLLVSAYSTISVADTALFLGMSEDDATSYALQHGWTWDSTARMLAIQKPKTVSEQKLDSSKLQSLVEYVFHLEH